MDSDIKIAQAAQLKPITEIAQGLGLLEKDIILYGRYKAKVNHRITNGTTAEAKLILVTAISPTPAGEGKTTTTVGLGDAMTALGHKTVICLREPSLGPVFGMKGGAAGGGYAQVVPMEDINLHFTGDLHAITAANNLLAAMTDNHIYQGNALGIDPRRVVWRRALDMNDRQLRFMVNGLGTKINGVPREDGFDITAASEVMAVFCLSPDLAALRKNLANIVVAYTFDNTPVTAGDLNAHGAMTALLRDAFDPNLVQTLAHTPALIHGGPFANIAHGCNSVAATRLAMTLGDYVITEAGFGADLGAEKFLDIKCRKAKLHPSAVVIVATLRALRHHGGAGKGRALPREKRLAHVRAGMPNLERHIENITQRFGLPAVVAVNRFPDDTEAELQYLCDAVSAWGVAVAVSDVYRQGGTGGLALAEKVVQAAQQSNQFQFAYALERPLHEKIATVARSIYGAGTVNFSAEAARTLSGLERMGYGALPVCMAKTQYSFSDDPQKIGAPADFEMNVRQVRLSAGAGFVVALTGDIMTMPGLPKVSAAEHIDVDADGVISGLF